MFKNVWKTTTQLRLHPYFSVLRQNICLIQIILYKDQFRLNILMKSTPFRLHSCSLAFWPNKWGFRFIFAEENMSVNFGSRVVPGWLLDQIHVGESFIIQKKKRELAVRGGGNRDICEEAAGGRCPQAKQIGFRELFVRQKEDRRDLQSWNFHFKPSRTYPIWGFQIRVDTPINVKCCHNLKKIKLIR